MTFSLASLLLCWHLLTHWGIANCFDYQLLPSTSRVYFLIPLSFSRQFLKGIKCSSVICAVCLVAQYCLILCDPMDCSLSGSSVHGIPQALILEWVAISSSRGSSQPRDRTQVFSPFQADLSHQGSPRILEWLAYPFFRGSSWPRNWTEVFCIAGGLFTSWATREAQVFWEMWKRKIQEI